MQHSALFHVHKNIQRVFALFADGKVYDRQPWSFSRILAIFLGFFAAIKYL